MGEKLKKFGAGLAITGMVVGGGAFLSGCEDKEQKPTIGVEQPGEMPSQAPTPTSIPTPTPDYSHLSADERIAIREIRRILKNYEGKGIQLKEENLLVVIRKHLRPYLGTCVEDVLEKLKSNGVLDELLAGFVLPDAELTVG